MSKEIIAGVKGNVLDMGAPASAVPNTVVSRRIAKTVNIGGDRELPVIYTLTIRPGATKEMIDETVKHFEHAAACAFMGVPVKEAAHIRTDYGPSPHEDYRVAIFGDLETTNEEGDRVWVSVNRFTETSTALDLQEAIKLAALVQGMDTKALKQEIDRQKVSDSKGGAVEGYVDWKGEAVPISSTLPNKNQLLFADGEVVAFKIDKITLGVNAGTTVYQLGRSNLKYPIKTIYLKDKNGKDSQDYKTVQESIKALGLAMDNLEVTGHWIYVAKVNNNKDDSQQFINSVGLIDMAGREA